MAIRQALAGCALLLTLSACDAGSDPRVRDIEGVAGQTFADPSTLSFTIDGGAKDVTLNGVFSTMAIETRMIDADGKPLRPGVGIVIPAGETVRFAPPGPYVQLIEVNRVARGLDEIELSFTFSDNNVLYATAPFTTPEGAARP